jgi:Na+/melibiose symporter-like transporter
VLGYTPLQAGLASLPFTAGIMIGAGLAQSLVSKLGARETPVLGAAIGTVGLLLFLRLEPGGSYLTDLLPAIVVVSVGMGLAFVPVTLIATSGIPVDDAGLASGLYNTSQQIGGALGLALLSTFAANKTADALAGAGGKPTPEQTASALVDGFHVAWLGSAIFLAAGAVLIFALLRREDVLVVAHGEAETVAI